MTFYIFLTGPHTLIAYTSWNNKKRFSYSWRNKSISS